MRVGSGVQTDAITPNQFGTCSASWENTTHKSLYSMRNERAWPNNVGSAVQTDPAPLGR